jgi:hypothetical protein
VSKFSRLFFGSIHAETIPHSQFIASGLRDRMRSVKKKVQTVSEYLSTIGRKGGAVRSEAKKKACTESLKKARAERLKRFCEE